jgi:hypothetical protein
MPGKERPVIVPRWLAIQQHWYECPNQKASRRSCSTISLRLEISVAAQLLNDFSSIGDQRCDSI